MKTFATPSGITEWDCSTTEQRLSVNLGACCKEDGLKQPTLYPPPRHIDSQSMIQQDSARVLLRGKSTVGL